MKERKSKISMTSIKDVFISVSDVAGCSRRHQRPRGETPSWSLWPCSIHMRLPTSRLWGWVSTLQTILPFGQSTIQVKPRHVSTVLFRLMWLLCYTLCPRYRDSPFNRDPTSVLVNWTPRYPDKMLFCPDNECPVKEDWSPVNEDYPQSLLSGLNTVLSC